MDTKKIFLLTLTIVLISCGLPSCKKAWYDHYQLALTWPVEYCSQNRCVKAWQKNWDGKSMIIHGFWPGSEDLSYLSCLIENKYDPHCHHAYDFSYSKFTKSEKKDLQKYWPQIGQIKNFWAYQWNKHGTCYLHIIKDEEKSTLTTTNIFKEYFIQTINKVKELGITLTKGKINTKKDLANKIGLHPSEFYAICGRDNELDEVRICYDIYYIPGEERVVECPESRDRNQCEFPMYVK